MTLDNTERITLSNENDSHASWTLGSTRFYVDGFAHQVPLGFTTEQVIALMNDKLKAEQRVRVTVELDLVTRFANNDEAQDQVESFIRDIVDEGQRKACETLQNVDIAELDTQVE